ncbi:synaptotagmin-4 [Quercus suber]|uniref:Synaptotagmin-4 n=1 Tax=Quercus suber TaxID=58331 RepID=A0AAW0LH71_QUESU
MSFYVGMIMGVTLGIGFIVAFARYENVRSKRRSNLAKVVAGFSRMTVEDSRKILPDDFYPTWVLTWLNLQLDKIWPYVDEATSELIRNKVEPILEQHRPAILASLKFSKLTLGTVAPQFTGVSIIESESDAQGVTMELEMQWDGNPHISLDIKTKLGVALPIQVKNIGFTGVFKLIFKPFVDVFPCFGAVSYSLSEKKKLDFTLKIVGGDVSAIPGVSDAIEETIRDAIEDSITWPVRKVIPILPGDYSDLDLKPVGTLEVKLVQAKDLLNKDLIGKSDPYAVVFVRPLRDRMKTSKIIVQLELLYCPIGTESSFTNPFDPDYSLTALEKALKNGTDGTEVGGLGKTTLHKKSKVIVRGVLSVTVISAEDLPVVDLMGKADPYVILTMKKSETKARTRVLNNNLNPAWNQTFDFVVEDALHEMLIAEVWDHDTFGKDKIGSVVMTLTRVILEGEIQGSFQIDGAKSGKLNLHLKWIPQNKIRDF